MAKKQKKFPEITAIVCADKNYAIGKNGQFLIQIPNDFKRLQRLSSGGTIIVGRKTFETMQTSKLPKRTFLVISHSAQESALPEIIKNKVNFISMDAAKQWLSQKREEKTQEKIVVAGGGEVFKELLLFCDMLHITKVFKAFETPDAYFPNIDFDKNWKLDFADDIGTFEDVKYQYRRYRNAHPISS